MTATVRQCAVLVGGLGTRLGQLTADTPKPLLPCGDRPFLAWLLRDLVRFGVDDFVLLTGHLSDVVEAAIPAITATLPKQVRITCAREPLQAGTAGALFHARDLLTERFLLCNGDSWFDFNLARLLADARLDPGSVIGRLVLRQVDDASRYGVTHVEGDRVVTFQERSPQGSVGCGGLINAGIYLFDRRILAELGPSCSLERDVLPRLATAGALRGTIGGREGGHSGFFIDIGIPADLALARAQLPARMHRPGLFLDRDGVINIDHGWVGTSERFEFVPGALDAIAAAADAGFHVFVVTNQSGIARGLYDEAQFAALIAWMIEEIRAAGGNIDDLRYCPYHPQAVLPAYRRDSDWRKPAPGMLLDVLSRWDVDPAKSLLIGDQASDLEAAAAAGVTGHLFTGGNLATFLVPLLRRLD